MLLLCINAGGELSRAAGPKADGRTSQTLCCCRDNSWVAATAAATKAARIPIFVAAYQRGGGGGRSYGKERRAMTEEGPKAKPENIPLSGLGRRN